MRRLHFLSFLLKTIDGKLIVDGISKEPGASPEAFKNMNSPHEEKPKQASGYPDPKGMNDLRLTENHTVNDNH